LRHRGSSKIVQASSYSRINGETDIKKLPALEVFFMSESLLKSKKKMALQ